MCNLNPLNPPSRVRLLVLGLPTGQYEHSTRYDLNTRAWWVVTLFLLILMYSAHLSRRASAPTHYNWQFNEEPKDPRKEACHTKGGIPAIPRAKPEGKSQAGSQPMRRRLGRRDYSSLKIAGTRTGIPDHSCPPLLPLPHPPLTPPPPPATEPWLTSKLTPGPGERGRGEVSPG